MSKPSLFLDRDGVINSLEHGFANEVSQFVFAEGALEAIRVLSLEFEYIFVVTNQAGVGYGYMTSTILNRIHGYMMKTIQQHGGRIDRVYHCPNRVEESALCRKPNIGMGLQAQKDFPTLDLANCWMVGDRATDIEFGRRLSMQTAFLTNDFEHIDVQTTGADFYFDDLLSFATEFSKIG